MVTIIIVVYKSDTKKNFKGFKNINNNFNIIIVDNSSNYDFSKLIFPKNSNY